MALKKKRAAKRRAWNKGLEIGQRDAFTPAQVKRIRQVLAGRGVPGLRDLALFSVAIDTMLQGPELLNLTVKDVQLPNGTIRSIINVARTRRKPPVRCALSEATAKALGKWIAVSGKKAHRLYFLWPWRRASSSDDGPANEPSAEILGCRGRARSQEVRQGIFTTDEGSPHLEWHRRFGDGPDALGAREDRVYVEISTYCQKVRPNEISTYCQKVRPNRNFSRLRYLTLLAEIKERWHIDDRLCVRQSRFASCMGKGCEHCRRPPSSPSGLFWTDVKRA
jgi:integrase